MKTLQVVFTEKEYAELKKAKHKMKNGVANSWRTYLLKTARAINNEKRI